MSFKATMGFLVGEPNKQVRGILAKILDENGYKNVTFVSDAQAVLDELHKHETDLALLDFDLAAENNFRVVDEVALDKHLYRLPLVLMGNNSPMGLIDEAMRLGAREYINKPFTPYLLMVRLEKIILGPQPKVMRRKAAAGTPEAAQGELEQLPVPKGVVEQQNLSKRLFLDGHEMLKNRQYDKALKRFAAAARVNMLFPEAYKGLAEVFRAMGMLDRSSQFLAKAGETYAWLGNDEEAGKVFEVSRKMDPSAPNPYKTVGDHLAGQKQSPERLRAYERAVELSPKDHGARVALSRAYADSGQKERATAALRPLMGKGEIPPDMRHLIVGVNRAEAEPGREINFMSDTVGGGDGVEKRGAKRIPLAEYAARTPRGDDSFAVVDASISGISFKHNGQQFEVGEQLTLDLLTMDGVKVKKLKAVVKRVAPRVVGLEIRGLTGKQRDVYTSIVPTY